MSANNSLGIANSGNVHNLVGNMSYNSVYSTNKSRN